MSKGQKEIIGVRVISVSFAVMALAVFRPFGLSAWQWNIYFHLLVIWVLGVGVCMMTEFLLKYVLRMPRSTEHGVNYIIRRNLWFQVINTPLIAFMICIYRHFVLSNRMEGNQLSWSNYLETLAIIGFCSFAIGLYWRFRFRSRYLAAELKETRMLNEQLQKLQQEKRQFFEATEEGDSIGKTPTSVNIVQPSSVIVLTGTTSEKITLQISNLLYVETIGNYVKVYQLCDGQVRSDMLRATSKQMEEELSAFPMIVRCHRAFLVNLQQVEQIVSKSGSMQLLMKSCHESLPVSRSNMAQVKEAIKSV